MAMENPIAIDNLLAFFKKAGLVCQKRLEHEVNDNKLYEYLGSEILMQVVLDRGSWIIVLGEIDNPGKWYYARDLRQLLFNTGYASMSISDQARFFEENWDALVKLFRSNDKDTIRKQLAQISKERVRRLLPKLFE